MLICKSAYLLSVKMKTMIYQNQFLFMFHLIFCCFAAVRSQNASATSSTIRCLPHQSSALLQLKQEFRLGRNVFDEFYRLNPFEGVPDLHGHPKMKFWKAGKDCCDWDGVTCAKTGEVVGLDLSDSWLQGPLHPNSSLFGLRQLQQLNLAFNNFSFSRIPSRFGQLSKLTHLNLSYSFLSRDVPSEIAWLTNLISLDLSNWISFDTYLSLLHLRVPTLFQNVTNLRELRLDFVNLSSLQTQSLANLSSLTFLSLRFCSLVGEFPKNIFQLPKIQVIDLSYNFELSGVLPEFHSSSKLKSLILPETSFSGELPNSIGNLISLNDLDLFFSNFSGTIPPSIGNLSQLTKLSLSYNNFNGQLPSTLGNLSQLTDLSLSSNNFNGQLPSTLENLSQLTDLSLSYNNFNGQLPSTLGNLSQLTDLSLSYNNFNGQLPSTLGNLSQLTYLSLSSNNFNGQLPSTLGNLSQLTDLSLSSNNFNGQLPSTLGNLSQLTDLSLSFNNFNGQLPSTLGNLSQLTDLSLSSNNFNGQLPSTLGNLSQLTDLSLSSNNFNGQLPSTLGNLANLTYLGFSQAGFSGEVPSSFGNLVQLEYLQMNGIKFHLEDLYFLKNLSRLKELSIRNNSFYGQFPLWMTNLTQLQYLDMSDNSFNGSLPSSLFRMPSLEGLYLKNNNFTGTLPLQNISSSQLIDLYLRGNKLNGKFPRSISKLKNLWYLNLASNNFSGTIEMDFFSKLSSLSSLYLSDNSLSVTYQEKNSTLPNFTHLHLSSCNIGPEFPNFLRTQNELHELDLSNNKIEGKISQWFFSTSIETLRYLNLSHNSLNSWEQAPFILQWRSLEFLDIRSNALQGSLVVPPFSIYVFSVSKNKLSGRIPSLFCKLSNLEVLDVSNNHLNGTIPQCLSNSSRSLWVLDMKRNNFHGTIPQTFLEGSQLETLDLSHNRLQGKIPPSLITCGALEVLNLGNNQISDTFPFWLQNLPNLKVLVLRSNKLYGPIWHPQEFLGFLKLRMVDLSFNNFSGELSSNYFRNWSTMTKVPLLSKSESKYVGDDLGYYHASMTFINKGLEMVLVKILTIYTSIDLSNNNFYGEIPSSIGDLHSLVVLNLSSNNFEGHIPSSLGNLRELESLDLSKNKLIGRIPPQLGGLTFLEYLNLSENQLTGPIPQGGQINTFQESSFEGNKGLCDFPLQKKCGNVETPASHHNHESESMYGFGWKVVAMGYGCGFVIGIIIGHLAISRWPNYFEKIYRARLRW